MSSRLAGEVVGGSTFSPLFGRACVCVRAVLFFPLFFPSRNQKQMAEGAPNLVF